MITQIYKLSIIKLIMNSKASSEKTSLVRCTFIQSERSECINVHPKSDVFSSTRLTYYS